MTLHTLRLGLDLPLAGAPAPRVDAARAVTRVAMLASDFPGLKPTMLVQPGDAVLRGSPLVEDKRLHGVRHAAPAAGVVRAVHRGERRALISVVIDVAAEDGPLAQRALDRGADVRALLLSSGLWTSLRARPFGHVADPAKRPAAIFVTAIDTRPHAPDIATVLAGREDDVGRGIEALLSLTDGPVYVCTAQGASIDVPRDARVKVEQFQGPHPAGLAGTHIHLLCPAGHPRTVWYAAVQDVAAIGRLVATGEIDVERVVSLAGPGVREPRHVRTRLGAAIDELTEGELRGGVQRVISGSVLDGRVARGDLDGYLGRYHQQVSALPEGGQRELFGWIAPASRKFSIWNVVAGALARKPLALDTSTNGGRRAMVPIGAFERVMPLDILPTFLLRALLTRDDERAEALGALELEEDDLALCTFVSPGKDDFGPLLRETLTRLEKEAA
jgi:Na+-transporting NADH:ubiquinone oxidoreductase subunit A